MMVIVLGTCPALAFFDMGYGMGWGMFHTGPSPSTTFVNDLALIRAGQPRNLPSQTPYANNPNSYINRIRDNGFVSHGDVRRRRAPTYQPEPTASLGNSVQAAAQPAAAKAATNPLETLSGFFDTSQKLVWPSDSPSDGELKEKREISNQAILTVLEETKQQGTASISTVAYARQRLLNYGRPALQEIRETATPRIADSFHSFMLSLYDALAQVAPTS
jgi:hypothetical protein